MNDVASSPWNETDFVSGLHALAVPSVDPLFWRAKRLGAPSAWWEHVPFGHWAVCAARPRVLVELGTHAGVSYTSFCEAVARSGLDTRCYAVDTWHHDQRAGSRGEEVFEEFRRFHDERYGAFSSLLRTTFDEALAQFANGTVDMLHIDGLHTYDGVRHDFESWKPKLSQGAVVLFHDTNERRDDFGVWRLWAELADQHPHFEFLHGHGLGVLAIGNNVAPAVLSLCQLFDPLSVAAVRSRFAALGERCLSQTRERMLERDLHQRIAAVTMRAELAQRDAEARTAEATARVEQAERGRREAEARARESERAREQVVRRMAKARHDVYEANTRAEHANERVERACAAAKETQSKARQAEFERDHARQERDALLSSTIWQATWPVRLAASRLPPGLRRPLRAATKLAWWSLTLKLRGKLRERR